MNLEKQLSIHLVIEGLPRGGSSFTKGKVTKSEAHYRPSDGEFCRDCRHFSNSSCALVAGKIQPLYVSDYYEPKEDAERRTKS